MGVALLLYLLIKLLQMFYWGMIPRQTTDDDKISIIIKRLFNKAG